MLSYTVPEHGADELLKILTYSVTKYMLNRTCDGFHIYIQFGGVLIDYDCSVVPCLALVLRALTERRPLTCFLIYTCTM